jgi:hypothetical protein
MHKKTQKNSKNKNSMFHCEHTLQDVGDSPHIEMLTNFFHPLTERSNLKTKIKGKGDKWQLICRLR